MALPVVVAWSRAGTGRVILNHYHRLDRLVQKLSYGRPKRGHGDLGSLASDRLYPVAREADSSLSMMLAGPKWFM